IPAYNILPPCFVAGDGANKMTSAHRLQWNNIDGQVTEDGLMRLTPDGETVVSQDGLYFVYSQVYFQLTPSRPPGRNFSFFPQSLYNSVLILRCKTSISERATLFGPTPVHFCMMELPDVSRQGKDIGDIKDTP
ncbi:MAG: hypothetical protein D3916_10640, partial [Candidatus Electrothrix sp. MAN1_4]|nr:hypothetical protein [Candidatus Electrothrix sp. MAN1_4]